METVSIYTIRTWHLQPIHQAHHKSTKKKNDYILIMKVRTGMVWHFDGFLNF